MNSYDTSYGLKIVPMYLGDEIHAMDVHVNKILSIRTPKINGEQWFTAWDLGVELVNTWVKTGKVKELGE